MLNSAGRQIHLEQASDLHDRMLTLDAHIDILLDFGEPDKGALVDGPSCFDLVKAARGKLSAAALSIHTTLAKPGPGADGRAREELEQRYRLITDIAQSAPERARIVTSPSQLSAAHTDGVFGIILSLQNASSFEDLVTLDDWKARGVSILDLAFIGNNRWTDSARPYPYISQGTDHGGLSALGKAAVGRMNDLGIVVDTAQISSQALHDVIAVSRQPVISSHTAPQAIVAAGRNLSDDDMLLIARAGGVVHVVGFAPYLRSADAGMQATLGALWMEYGLAAPESAVDFMSINDPATAHWSDAKFWDFLHAFHEKLELDKPRATIDDYVDALEHTVRAIGIDHVGIGSDFNHASGVVGWMNVGDNLNITAELLRRGYDTEAIEKLWGGNFRRVWQQVLTGAIS